MRCGSGRECVSLAAAAWAAYAPIPICRSALPCTCCNRQLPASPHQGPRRAWAAQVWPAEYRQTCSRGGDRRTELGRGKQGQMQSMGGWRILDGVLGEGKRRGSTLWAWLAYAADWSRDGSKWAWCWRVYTFLCLLPRDDQHSTEDTDTRTHTHAHCTPPRIAPAWGARAHFATATKCITPFPPFISLALCESAQRRDRLRRSHCH